MMQVTGNSVQSNRSLSILIHTDGLSFFVADLNELIKQVDVLTFDISVVQEILETLTTIFGTFNKVHIIVSSDRNVIIPSEIYQKESINNYFTMKGVDIDFNNDYIITSTNNNSIYIWLLNRELVDYFNTFFEEVIYIHILEVLQHHGVRFYDKLKKNGILVCHEGNLLSVAAFEKGDMIFQEMFEVNSSSDIVFYIKALLSRFSIGNFQNGIIVIGYDTDNLTSVCSNFTKKVIQIGYL